MECPVSDFQQGTSPRPTDLDPYSCPLVYCPPSSGIDHEGNYTYSICVKYIDDINPANALYLNKTCAIGNYFCTLGCERKSWFQFAIDKVSVNYTTYVAAGCRQGNHINGTVPPSFITSRGPHALDVGFSSSAQSQNTLTVPLLLTLLLVVIFIQKKKVNKTIRMYFTQTIVLVLLYDQYVKIFNGTITHYNS